MIQVQITLTKRKIRSGRLIFNEHPETYELAELIELLNNFQGSYQEFLRQILN